MTFLNSIPIIAQTHSTFVRATSLLSLIFLLYFQFHALDLLQRIWNKKISFFAACIFLSKKERMRIQTYRSSNADLECIQGYPITTFRMQLVINHTFLTSSSCFLFILVFGISIFFKFFVFRTIQNVDSVNLWDIKCLNTLETNHNLQFFLLFILSGFWWYSDFIEKDDGFSKAHN